MKRLTYLLLSIALLVGCSGNGGDSSLTLKFEGRKIDIAPYFRDFPYSQFSVSKDGEKLFFFKTGNENNLQWLDLTSQNDIRKANNVVDVNFAVRNCWSPRYNKTDNSVYWIGDESNDEIINIYRTKLGSNSIEKLTSVPYIYAWNFNPEGTKIAYVSRLGQNEHRLDELRVIDLSTLEDTLICQDNSDFRFTWSSISWQPNGAGFMLLALKGMDRTFTNVAYVDAATGNISILTDSAKEASVSGCSVISDWISPKKAVFLSDQDGYTNLYSYDVVNKKVKQLTQYSMNIDDVEFIDVAGEHYLLMTQSNPIETKIILFDPVSESVVMEQSSDMGLSMGTAVADKVIMVVSSTTNIFQLQRFTVGKDTITTEVMIDTPADIRESLVHSTVERLEIPTFDIDPATGSPRIIHAYLYKPTKPLPDEKKIVMIESFYGGMNRYNDEYQIMCQAGAYILSPAPRGSAGFGRDFAAMNDKDLGGNEIIDIIYSAHYISEMLNVPAERIGVFGMSHGGYATMRLMTFPGEVNGNSASFPFGFGIETAGFCDIIWQHNHSNIPDWTALEAGDPAIDSLKLVDRSPITHADKITGPILLIHGDHDNRVDIGGSQFMAEKLEQLNKPYKYVIFPGLGHGIKGTENNLKFYSENFNFIEKMVLNKK